MRWFIYLCPFLLMLALLPHSAQAHANLIESDPSANSVIAGAPPTARLRFSEPLEPSYSRVRLLDTDGELISTTPSRVDPADTYVLLLDLPPIPEGRYVLQWRALSTVDGHTTQGVVPFAIGDPQAADAPLVLPPPPSDPLAWPPVTDVVLRWLTYLMLAIVLGSLIFRWYVWREGSWSQPGIDQSFNHMLRRIELGAVLGAVLASISMLLAASATAEAQVIAFTVNSRVGTILALRAALLIILATVLWQVPDRYRYRLGLGIGGIVLLSISLLSHSAVPQAQSNALMQHATTGLTITFDWIHLFATIAWIGGFFPLLLALWTLRREEPPQRACSATVVVARFTALATAAVITLAATGAYAAFQQVASISQLWTTTYGRALSLKLGLFGVLLLLGGYNRWRAYPQLATLCDHTAPATKVAVLVGRLRRSIGTEIMISILLLLAVGVLTAVMPAREATASGPGYMQRARVGSVQLTLQVVSGGLAGDLFALDIIGLPRDIQPTVVLRASMATHEMGEQELVLHEVEPNRWGARGALIVMDGLWNIEAIVRAPGMDDVRHTFEVDTLAQRTASVSNRVPPLWALLLLGALLLAALSQLPATLLWRSRLQTASLIFVGGTFVAAIVPYYLARTGEPTNPLRETPTVLAAGRAIYEQHCVACHGMEGRGDGPVARSLPGLPADFTDPHLAQHSDGELFRWIKAGKPGTAMPGFEDHLSDEQIWQVITYIRRLHADAQP